MSVHAATIDYSPDSDSLVVCTCGLALGPFHEYGEAKKAAAEHRRWTGAEVVGSEDRRLERRRQQNAKAAARRAAKKRSEAGES